MLFGKKEYRGAGQALAKVSVSDSHYMEALFLLGICTYQQTDYDASVTDFRMVATQVPINEVFNNLGAVLLRKGDLAGADQPDVSVTEEFAERHDSREPLVHAPDVTLDHEVNASPWWFVHTVMPSRSMSTRPGFRSAMLRISVFLVGLINFHFPWER